MHRLYRALFVVALGALAAVPAQAQGTVKIGVIMPYSGQFADLATQMDNGIKLYMKQKGDTVAGKKIVIIRKDSE
jgi:branched-chain amino acid transport system substrate-binding protein